MMWYLIRAYNVCNITNLPAEKEVDWPSLIVSRDQSSLLLFHKINCGAVSIDRDLQVLDPCSYLQILPNHRTVPYTVGIVMP